MATIRKEFPYCVNAGASKTREIKTKNIQFGDGYESIFSVGINNTSVAWSCSKTATKSVIDEIEAFIVSHKNIDPFYMTFSGQRGLYRTVGSIQLNQDSGEYWTISFNVKQAFNLA